MIAALAIVVAVLAFHAVLTAEPFWRAKPWRSK